MFPPPWLTGTRGVRAPLGEPLPKVPPFLIEDLLDALGLPRDTPRSDRDAAITAWLAGNEPCLGLVLDLEADGYYRRREGSREAGRTAAEAARRAAGSARSPPGWPTEFAEPPLRRGKIAGDAHRAEEDTR